MNTPFTKEQVEKLPVRRKGFSGFTATSDGENREMRRMFISRDRRMDFNNRKVTEGRKNYQKRLQQKFGEGPALTWLTYRDFLAVVKFRSDLTKAQKPKLAAYFARFSYKTINQQARAIRTRYTEIMRLLKGKKK